MSQEKKWYMVQVQSSREKAALKLLDERITHKEKKHDFEIYPLEQKEIKVVKGKGGMKKKEVMKPIFKGYVLIKAFLNDENLDLLLKTKYVQQVNGELTEHEAKSILSKIENSEFKAEASKINVGDHVKIINGPFSNFYGEVDAVDGHKVTVNVEIFGRPTPTKLDAADVLLETKTD